jgi:hypothetical protein
VAAGPDVPAGIEHWKARIPVYSAALGGPLGGDPGWAARAGNDGRLQDALSPALGSGPSHLIEIAGDAAPAPAAPHRSSRLLPPGADGDELLRLVADLYRAGLDPAWDRLYEPARRVRHRLSPYAFATTGRFWWPPLPTTEEISR